MKWQRLSAGVLTSLLIGMASWTGTAAAEPTENAAVAEQTDVNKRVVINLAARSIALFKNDQKVYLFPIGPGKASTPTPTGISARIVCGLSVPRWTARSMT